MNCGTELKEQFCHVCGQRKQRRVVSVLAVFGEFFSELANWDSRLWRTLWPLFFRPGQLTRAYMDGKRARYIPPIRLYLISSIVFFVAISFSPKAFFNDIGSAVDQRMGGLDQPVTSQIDGSVVQSILKDAGVADFEVTEDDNEATDASEDNADDDTGAVESNVELDARTVVGVDDPAKDDEAKGDSTDQTAAPNVKGESTEPTVDEASEPQAEDSEAAVSDTSGAAPDESIPGDLSESDTDRPATILEHCEEIKTAELGRWELLRSYFYNTCLSFSTWRGLLNFFNELIDNLPKTLLALLPLMALFNKLIYWFPKRYYVEHLLFYVHNFSFLFLFSLTLWALSALIGLFGPELGDLIFLLGLLYTIYYYFRSMRVVYEQGRFLTFIKWITQSTAFVILTPFVLTFFALATAALHAL